MRVPRKTQRSGTVVVKVVLCLGVLFAVAALNLDGGRGMDERRRAQTAPPPLA